MEAKAAARQPNRPKEKKVFTDLFLKNLPPAEKGKRDVYWDAASQSFGCRVTDRGVVSFFVMRRMPGKKQPVRIALGRYPDIALANGRKAAERALSQIVSGVHPRECEREERAQKQAERRSEEKRQKNTFAALAELYKARSTNRNRTAADISKVIDRHLIPRWGTRVASEITRREAVELAIDIGERCGRYAAAQVITYGSAIFNYGLTLEFGDLDRNPCHLVKVAVLVGEMESRQRVLSNEEIATLWKATAGLQPYPAAPYARLLLLTGARRNEVARMSWSEVDLDGALWTIPGERRKHRTRKGEPLEVPLSGEAVQLLRSMPRLGGGNYIFSTTGGRIPIRDFGHIKDVIDECIAQAGLPAIPGWRLHDLRRTLRTGMSNLGIPPFIAEEVIGHRQKGVHAVYDLGRCRPEKRAALEKWNAHVIALVSPDKKGRERRGRSRKVLPKFILENNIQTDA